MSEHTNSMPWLSCGPIRSKNFWNAAFVRSSPTHSRRVQPASIW